MNLKLGARSDTAQKMKFSIKDLFSKFDQISRKLRIWSDLLKKSLIEDSFFEQCYQNFLNHFMPLVFFCTPWKH